MPSTIQKLEAGFKAVFPTDLPEPPLDSLDNGLRIFLQRLEENYNHPDDPADHLPTGIGELDKQQKALLPGHLIVVASRPGMGKTSFLANIVKATIHGGVTPVAIFAPVDEITTRLIALESKIPLTRLKSGRIKQPEWNKLSEAVTALRNSRVSLHTSALVSPQIIHSTVKELTEKKEMALIIFDGIDQLKDYWSRITNDDVESAIMRFFSELAWEYKCVVLLTTGLTRAVEERDDHRPRISDLGGSGAIELSADTIWMLYRDAVYCEGSNPPERLEVLTVKSKSTALGGCYLKFNPAIGLIG